MSDIKTTAFCSKCGRMTCGSATNDNCHWCGANIEYIYVEPNQEAKIIMQQQEKIAELQKRIDELEKQLAWIQVSDRLPENDVRVIMLRSDGYVEKGSRGYDINQELYWFSDGIYWKDFNITHWMPLPQPPEVKNE